MQQLVEDVSKYCVDYALYKQKVDKDREQYQGVNVSRIKRPVPPPYLSLWFELQRWPGHLLAEGGLYDQPDWTWEMVDLAGMIYREKMG